MIELKGISKVYGSDGVKTHALKKIDLKIEEGDFLAIMGPSGSGKSTLMHILGFLDKPTEGTYSLEGKQIGYENDDYLAKLRNKKIGFVFQSFNLLARSTVLENVILPLLYAAVPGGEMEKIGKKVLEEVGLSHRINHLANQLSGGEKQRVAIARALINNPKVLFADEPTGNLDSKTGAQIMDILQKLNDKGITVILVTHELFAAEAAKRIIHLKDGELEIDKLVSKRKIISRDGFTK